MTTPTIVHRSAAEGFSAKADNYMRGRPDYPDAIVGWLQDRLHLDPDKTVVDLGAGTGKFTAVLVKTGARVIAVEPIKEMRAKIEHILATADTLDGTATAIPLPDRSVDTVTCAQSFHWFATKAALAEVHRALKPGGTLGLIWNVRDESVDWVAKLTGIITPYEGDTPRFAKGTWRNVFPYPGFGPLTEESFAHSHVGSPEDVLIDRIRSTSFIAALPADEEAKVVKELRALIAATPALAGKDVIRVPYNTATYRVEKVR